jgi:membrane-associated phospholipid phosphatase
LPWRGKVFRVVFENFYLNKELFYLINHNRHPLLDAFFSKFYLLGKGWVLIPIFIGLFIFQKSSLKVFLYTMGISTVLVEVLKHLTKQPRPATLLEDVYLLEPLHLSSFPSGDSAMAFALASFFLWLNPKVGFVFLVYALLIAYGRVYLGAHFPLDVFAGALIGIFSFLLALRLA